jgi:hypothetical protein
MLVGAATDSLMATAAGKTTPVALWATQVLVAAAVDPSAWVALSTQNPCQAAERVVQEVTVAATYQVQVAAVNSGWCGGPDPGVGSLHGPTFR